MGHSLPRSTVILSVGLLLSLSVLTGCAEKTSGEAAPETASTADTAPSSSIPEPNDGLPIDAWPASSREAWNECPYLDTDWVSNTNGQRMTGIDVDPNFSYPACVFYSYPEEPQLTVMVRQMPSEQEATAVVDWIAPIDQTEPADLEGGWMGGRGLVEGREGSVFAVQRNNLAVVVLSNQEQSFKAQQVAEETIKNLGL